MATLSFPYLGQGLVVSPALLNQANPTLNGVVRHGEGREGFVGLQGGACGAVGTPSAVSALRF